jgi:hypothetical protein
MAERERREQRPDAEMWFAMDPSSNSSGSSPALELQRCQPVALEAKLGVVERRLDRLPLGGQARVELVAVGTGLRALEAVELGAEGEWSGHQFGEKPETSTRVQGHRPSQDRDLQGRMSDLLPQPSGFEGLVRGPVGLKSQQEGVAQGKDERDRAIEFELVSSARTPVGKDEDPIGQIGELLSLDRNLAVPDRPLEWLCHHQTG